MRILSILATVALLAVAGLVVYTYASLPPDPLRRLSGPPPIFSFEFAQSSGFFVDQKGHLITLRSAVQDCRRLRVAGQGFAAAPAEVVALPDRPGVNLALLRVDATPAATLPVVDVPDPPTREAQAALTGPFGVTGFRGDENTRQDIERPAFIPVVPQGLVRASDQSNYILFPGGPPLAMSGGAFTDGKGRVLGVYVGRLTVTAPSGVTQVYGGVIVGGEVAHFLRAAAVRADVVEPADQVSATAQRVAGAMARVFCFRTGYPRVEFYIPDSNRNGQR